MFEIGERQRAAIEDATSKVLSARAAHPVVTFSDMYDPDHASLFPDLMTAHAALDRAVDMSYGLDADATEDDRARLLLERYARMIEA